MKNRYPMNHTYVVIKKLITFFLFQTVAIVLFAQQIQVRNIPHIEQLPIGLINVFFKIVKGICGMVQKTDYAETMVIISMSSALIIKRPTCFPAILYPV